MDIVEDTGELLPDGQVVTPHRPTDTLALRLTQGHALIGGTARRGKTGRAALHASMPARSTSVSSPV